MEYKHKIKKKKISEIQIIIASLIRYIKIYRLAISFQMVCSCPGVQAHSNVLYTVDLKHE